MKVKTGKTERLTYAEWEERWEAAQSKRKPENRMMTKEEFLKKKQKEIAKARIRQVLKGFAAMGRRLAENAQDNAAFEKGRPPNDQ